MRAAICDDETRFIDELKEIIAHWNGGAVDVSCFESAEALEAACDKEPFDIAFIDVELGSENGVALARRLSENCPAMKVVFITAFVVEYAERIFLGITPYGFVGKPLAESKIHYYLTRLDKEMQRANCHLSVQTSGLAAKVLAGDIIFAESEKRVVHIHCVGGTITVYERLDDIEKRLDDRFVRCHQSFLVNMDFISRLDGGTFILKDKTFAPVRISHNRLGETRRKYFGYVGRDLL